MKKPTSKDVAKLAGVSQSTVSFVLNNRQDMKIPEKTFQKVLAAAKELNYIPNSFAQGLKTRKSKLIGLLIPTITNPFYPMMAQQIEEYAALRGYNILLCNTNRQSQKEEFYLNLLVEKQVDGVILGFTPRFPKKINKLSKQLPMVMVGEKDDSLKIHTIGLNSVKAGEIITQHLIDFGHTNFAYITSPFKEISKSREKRLEGIISKLEEHGLENKLIVKTETAEKESLDTTYEIEIGYTLTLELLRESEATAIICVNDMVALGAINAIVQSGFKVPDDLSVCGFDNIYLSKMLQPKITTIEHNITHRCKLAVDTLIDSTTDNASILFSVEYEPQLIPRDSTGPIRIHPGCRLV